jgi:hypothetical protein
MVFARSLVGSGGENKGRRMSTMNMAGRTGTENLRRGGWQKGCLIAFVVVLVLIGAGIVTIMLTWKRMAAAGIVMGTEAMVQQSSLPQGDKDRIVAKVGKVADDFKSGKMSMEQFAKVMQSVMESPLLPLGVMTGVEAGHLAKSGLSAEEKEGAKAAMSRFARGVADKTLSMDDLKDPFKHIGSYSAGPGPSQNFRLKEKVTDEELRAFVAALKEKADKAGVAAEVAPIDIATEVEKAIDEGLAKGSK